MRFKFLVAAVAALATLSMLPASADVENVAPPFDGLSAYRQCSGTLVSACIASVTVTHTGVQEASVSITSQSNGTLPGKGSGSADTYLSTYHLLNDAKAVVYTVNLKVTASAQHTGKLFPLDASFADVWLRGDAWFVVGGAGASFFNLLASTDGTSTAGEFSRTMVLTSFDGTPMNGPVALTFGVEAIAELGTDTAVPDSGTISVGARVEITSITAEILT